MRLATRTGAAAAVALALTATALQARAEDRGKLIACQAMLDRGAQAASEHATKEHGAPARPDDTELTRCRQIVREWMLRDARMSVDERGQPLK